MPRPYTTSPQCHSTYLVLNITAIHKPDPYNVISLGCDLSPLLPMWSSIPHDDPSRLQDRNDKAPSTMLTTEQLTSAVDLLHSPWVRPTSTLPSPQSLVFKLPDMCAQALSPCPWVPMVMARSALPSPREGAETCERGTWLQKRHTRRQTPGSAYTVLVCAASPGLKDAHPLTWSSPSP